MTLTAAECRIAAERARKYPPGYGHSYIATAVTWPLIADVLGYASKAWTNLGSNDFATALLKKHPEYVEKG